jgi:hypothetical protein
MRQLAARPNRRREIATFGSGFVCLRRRVLLYRKNGRAVDS